MTSPLTHFPCTEVLNLHLPWKSLPKYSQNVANLIFILVTGLIFLSKTEKYIVRSPNICFTLLLLGLFWSYADIWILPHTSSVSLFPAVIPLLLITTVWTTFFDARNYNEKLTKSKQKVIVWWLHIGVNSTIKAAIKLILEQMINARFKEKACFDINNLLFSIYNWHDFHKGNWDRSFYHLPFYQPLDCFGPD